MELYKEILVHMLEKEEVRVYFPNVEIDGTRIVEMECYKALQKIQAIIKDSSLEDGECFMKIEEIVCMFESMGSGGGSRHDFG